MSCNEDPGETSIGIMKNVFLHDNHTEIVYMHQPPDFYDPHHPDYVVCLENLSMASNVLPECDINSLLIMSVP